MMLTMSIRALLLTAFCARASPLLARPPVVVGSV